MLHAPFPSDHLAYYYFFLQWHVPVCALFKGHVVDRPEHLISDTPGGTIAHKVYMMERIILIVIELKLHLNDLRDHFAEVLLELECEHPFHMY